MATGVAATPEELRRRAREAMGAAAVARQLADDIDRRRVLLADRLGLSRHLHVVEVWDSAAATASRLTLSRSVAHALYLVDADLHTFVVALDQHAMGLDDAARDAFRSADRVADEVAAASTEAGS